MTLSPLTYHPMTLRLLTYHTMPYHPDPTGRLFYRPRPIVVSLHSCPCPLCAPCLVLRSLLADLPGLVEREAVKSPALIIVGEVARLGVSTNTELEALAR